MSRQRLTFPDEEFSMAIHDAGMFNVKEINRLKILQDVIDRNLRPGQAAEMLGITPRHCSRLLGRCRPASDHSDGRAWEYFVAITTCSRQVDNALPTNFSFVYGPYA